MIWDARVVVKSRIAETRAQRFLDACNEDGTLSVPLRYYAAHWSLWRHRKNQHAKPT